jgi:hypothetical protein
MATAQSLTAANIARSPQNGLGRLAAWCYDHRRRVLAGWLLALAAIIGLAHWTGSRLDSNSPVSDADQLAGGGPGLRPAGQRKGRRASPAIPAGGAAAVESRPGTRERRDQDAR